MHFCKIAEKKEIAQDGEKSLAPLKDGPAGGADKEKRP